jgi:hypothetical protein
VKQETLRWAPGYFVPAKNVFLTLTLTVTLKAELLSVLRQATQGVADAWNLWLFSFFLWHIKE